MEETLVTCYVNPDLDGFSCVFGYVELLRAKEIKAVPGIYGEIHEEIKFLLETFSIPFAAQQPDAGSYGKIVLVDASDKIGIEKNIRPDAVVEVIDHRMVNQSSNFANAKIQIEAVGAAATLVTERFIESGTPISRESSLLLYGAIVSNTLNFRASVTTDRDTRAAQWLAGICLPPEHFASHMFRAKSNITSENLQARMDAEFALIDLGKKVGIVQLEITNGDELLRQYKPELLKKIDALALEKKLDMAFLSIVNLNEGENFFVTDHLHSQEVLAGIFGIPFEKNVLRRPGFIMRKEISPLIQKYLQIHADIRNGK